MVPVGQGFGSLSAPLKEVQRLTLAGTEEKPLLRHGGNPAVRWMVDNLAVAMNPAGDVKPDKASGGDKIDAVSALVTALFEAMNGQPEEESVYESRGPLVINGL
jgi:phage terminase large subunit-like protein